MNLLPDLSKQVTSMANQALDEGPGAVVQWQGTILGVHVIAEVMMRERGKLEVQFDILEDDDDVQGS